MLCGHEGVVTILSPEYEAIQNCYIYLSITTLTIRFSHSRADYFLELEQRVF